MLSGLRLLALSMEMFEMLFTNISGISLPWLLMQTLRVLKCAQTSKMLKEEQENWIFEQFDSERVE